MANPVHGGNGHSGNGHSGNGHAGNGHAGHGEVTYEKTDITTGGLYVFGFVLLLIVLGAAGGMHLLFGYLQAQTDKQNRNLPEQVKVDTSTLGQKLPYDGDENLPLLEGIRATDPSAPRSGILGYTSLSDLLKKSSDAKLASYGYLDDKHRLAHIPVAKAIQLLAEEWKADGKKYWREQSPKGIEVGSIVNPYSFYRSDSSSGRESLGNTRGEPQK